MTERERQGGPAGRAHTFTLKGAALRAYWNMGAHDLGAGAQGSPTITAITITKVEFSGY